jgi:hypothetical protein
MGEGDFLSSLGAKECFFVLLVTTLGHHSKLVKVIAIRYILKNRAFVVECLTEAVSLSFYM